MIINSIELLNICNLKCDACPWYTSTFHKGLMTRGVFEKSISLLEDGSHINLQQFGEGLLHPELMDFISLANEKKLHTTLSTNGIKLTSEKMEQLISSGLTKLEISIHTKEAIDSWLIANQTNNGRIEIQANVLETKFEEFLEWKKDKKIPLEELTVTYVHNWALDEDKGDEYTKNVQSKCHFILSNECIVRWDGTITSCCFDSDSRNVVGNIMNFNKEEFDALTHNTDDYVICGKCSPSWINQSSFSGYYLEEWKKK